MGVLQSGKKLTALLSMQTSVAQLLTEHGVGVLLVTLLLAVLVLVLLLAVRQSRRHARQLAEANERLQIAVRECQKATQEAHAAMREAQKASQAKGSFLSRISHEIRTPLNAVLGFGRMAQAHADQPALLQSDLDKVQMAGQVLLGILNDVLDMAAIESDKLKLERQPFCLGEVIRQVDVLYESQCAQKGLEYRTRHHELSRLQVLGDPLRTQQVLINLLSNAVKFTPPGGWVRFSARLGPCSQGVQWVQLIVQDNGEGMNEEMQKNLFKPFEQEKNSVAGMRVGSGLGLSIVKALVEQMGGHVWVASKKGTGSSFAAELPLELAPQKAVPLLFSDQALRPPHLAGLRVLLVEDSEMNAVLARELIGQTGARVDWAASGAEALHRFHALPPYTYHLVLMDIQMPDMDGCETVRRLRSIPREDVAALPILAMSADCLPADLARARAAGMNGHIPKPIQPRYLYDALKRHWNEGATRCR